MKRFLTSRWLLVPLLACAAAIGCNRNGQGPPPPKAPEVLIGLPVSDTITDYEEFTGRTEPIHSVDIKARVNGYLTKIYFKDGADVKEDAPLFQIDPRPYKAERDRARASLNQAIARRELAQTKLERTRAAYAIRANSREDLDAANAEFDEMRAAVGIAEENLRIAELNLTWTTVRAPTEGRLTQRRIDIGNVVKADDTLLTTLHKLDPMYAYFDVDERTDLKISALARQGKIKPIRDGSVKVYMGLASPDEDGKFPHEGTVDFASAFLDSSTGTRAVRGIFSNKDMVLKPGLFARIRLPVGELYTATLLEERALGTDQGKKFVYVVKPEKVTEEKDGEKVERTLYRAIYRPFPTEAFGPLTKEKRVIREGLGIDELVIVSGLQRVRPGGEVVPVIKGKLRAGKVTTEGGGTWELDFSKLGDEEKEKLSGMAKKLNGEVVLVRGDPIVQRDSKRERRMVFVVREIKPAK